MLIGSSTHSWLRPSARSSVTHHHLFSRPLFISSHSNCPSILPFTQKPFPSSPSPQMISPQTYSRKTKAMKQTTSPSFLPSDLSGQKPLLQRGLPCPPHLILSVYHSPITLGYFSSTMHTATRNYRYVFVHPSFVWLSPWKVSFKKAQTLPAVGLRQSQSLALRKCPG